MIQTSYGLDEKNKKDLFVNMLMGGDKWGIPKSLGDNINTTYDEDYAYVSLDGRTLYFSSKGHNSIGGYDIFVSKRNIEKMMNISQFLNYTIVFVFSRYAQKVNIIKIFFADFL